MKEGSGSKRTMRMLACLITVLLQVPLVTACWEDLDEWHAMKRQLLYSRTYAVGDTGPAGGIIFHVNENYLADG